MTERSRLRYAMRRAAEEQRMPAAPGPHWEQEDWRRYVVDQGAPAAAEAVEYDERGLAKTPVAGVGMGLMKGLEGPLHEWTPGSAFPEVEHLNHLPRGPRGVLLRLLHPFLVPIADLFRAGYPKDWQYEEIPAEIQAELRARVPG